MDETLNTGFFVVHTAWIVFTCVGWIWKRTRPWQLMTVALSALSWFGLGVWYGWGYCPCTDWHWQVRTRLGVVDPPFAPATKRYCRNASTGSMFAAARAGHALATRMTATRETIEIAYTHGSSGVTPTS